ADLVATLAHPNGWHRDTAARLLYQRNDRSAVAALQRLAAESPRPEGRILALYALDSLDSLTADTVLARLADPHAAVRQHAIRVSERVLAESAQLRDKLYSLIADEDLRVRYQLAFTLGEATGPQRNAALAALAKRTPTDTWMRLAIRSSLAEGAGAVLAELAKDATFRQTPAGRDWLKQLSDQLGKQQRDDDIAELLSVLAAIPAGEAATLQAILQGLAAKPGSKLAEQVAAATGGRADELTKQLVADAAKISVNGEAKTAARVAAVQQLRLGRFDELKTTLTALLEPAQPAEVQQAALNVLGSFRDPQVASLLVERWASFSPRVRGQAAEVLFSRPEWIVTLLDAVQQNKIATGDVDP
ncbi:MAG TPA: HEAT repeat domain-containing protein, partial [Pirellulaceae bacterium]|nr:HEAT repeat domain-containing protein [Pirellulaceae bacterium]